MQEPSTFKKWAFVLSFGGAMVLLLASMAMMMTGVGGNLAFVVGSVGMVLYICYMILADEILGWLGRDKNDG